MNYFKYIFSDKKANTYWAIFYILIALPFLLGFFIDFGKDGRLDEFRPEDLLLYIFYTLAFFMFYSIGYFNLRRQEKFINTYLPHVDNLSKLDREVEIFRNSYTVTGIKTNFEGRIKPKPKRDIFKVFELDNLIVLIGKTYDFGVFRREICPIVIDINNYENPIKYRYAINPKISTANWIDNDLEIIFERSVYGIRKVKLFNWKK